MADATSITGFLLTRAWRDTAHGIELSFWATTVDGPLQIVIEGQEAVCFIERSRELALPADTRRQVRDLKLLGGDEVDALYFSNQRDLENVRGRETLHESDIKPFDRYLMERFIRAGFSAQGSLRHERGYPVLRNPLMRSADVVPSLSLVSLDIETRGRTDTLYCIAGALSDVGRSPSFSDQTVAEPAAVVFMVGGGEDEQRDGYRLTYADNERGVIEGFLAWLSAVDPDVLSGWSVIGFDLAFLERKCEMLGIPFALGRAGGRARVIKRSAGGAPPLARVPGRAVLDGIDLLKASFRVFESYSLENVSNELLGTGKLIGNETDKVAEINRLYRDDKPSLADYNIRDCTLVNEILEKTRLIEFAARRASLTGLPLERLAGAAAAFDNLYLPRLHRAGFVAPDADALDAQAGGPGGHVMDSEPGLFTDVLVLDFKSLYPSIIRSFLIDPLGRALGANDPGAVPGFDGASFAREGHILPDMIKSLWQARDAAKAANDAPLSQAIKIIMNSFYGVLGTPHCRFHHHELVASITRRGHEILTDTRKQVESAGHRVIYGDTDSLFVVRDGTTSGNDRNTGVALVDRLNDYWRERLAERYGLISSLELEYETHYSRFFMPSLRGVNTGSKKRYAGLVETPGQEPQLIIKGLEAVRSDWTPLARDFQRELLRRVFTDEPWEEWIRETVARLKAGDLDDSLVYRRRLRRRLADYESRVPPHVQAARQLASPGQWIRYVMTREGPQPLERLSAPPDHEHYLERQLAPAGDGVLRALGSSVSELIDAQMRMF